MMAFGVRNRTFQGGGKAGATPKSIYAGYAVIIMLCAGCWAWAAHSMIAGAVIADGLTVRREISHPIQHHEGGVLLEILVSEGDFVVSGQDLLRLDHSERSVQREVLQMKIYDLASQRDRLSAELDDSETIDFAAAQQRAGFKIPEVRQLLETQTRQFEIRKSAIKLGIEQLDARLAQIRRQRAGIGAQKHAFEKQLAIAQENLTSQSALFSKGITHASAVRKNRSDVASLEGQLAVLDTQLASLASEIIALKSRHRSSELVRREENMRERSAINDRLRAHIEAVKLIEMSISNATLKAPVSGRVFGMSPLATGMVLRAADVAMSIVPEDQSLLVVTQIRAAKAVQVFVDQPVTIQFSQAGREDAIEMSGNVEYISADFAIAEGDGAAFYKVEIELDTSPGSAFLRSGTPVEIYFPTLEQTAASYLLNPISKYFSSAFRER